jgi:MFS family permease
LLPADFPAEEQDKAIGIYSMFTGVGVAIGPFLGGVIIQYLSWRYVFWVNVPIILVGLLCCLTGLQPDKVQPSEERFDFLGYSLFAVAVILLICGIIYEPQQVTHHIAVIALIAAVVIFAVFAVVQLRVKHPFMEIGIFANKYTFAALLVCIAACVVTNVFFFFDPLYLKAIRQLPAIYIGLILVTMPLMQVFISMFFERIISRFGVYMLLLVGMSAALVAALLNILFSYDTSYLLIVFTLLMIGISWGVANTGSIAAVSKHIAEEKAGAAIGSIFTFWNLMGAAFLASTSTFFVAQQKSHLKLSLKTAKFHLSSAQQQLLFKSIHDPSRARIILTHLKDKGHALYHFFAGSFIYALHSVSILMSVVLLLVLLCGVIGKYRKA